MSGTIDDNAIKDLFKKLKVDTSVYPNISNVVVARNYNSTQSKRLLYDFLDIYTSDFYDKITPPQNLTACKIDNTEYYIDFCSSGIFDKIPVNINNINGENIQGFINIIQNLCNNVPINLDVHGIFSGITDSSTIIEEKILCKMRLNMMILGRGDIQPGKPIDKSYYSFDILQPTSVASTPTPPRIIAYGTGECEHTDKLYAKQFNFKIIKFDTSSSGSTYVVSVSSSFDDNTALLPLPDYFIKNIGKDTSKPNYLASPDHCVGFSRKGTYNVKFVITEDQYKLVFEKKTTIYFKGPSINFNIAPSNVFPRIDGVTPEDPFPGVLWTISGKSGSSSAPASARAPPPAHAPSSALKEPSVATDDPPTNITESSATIKGTITDKNDNIQETGFYYIKATTAPTTDAEGMNEKIKYNNSSNTFTINITALDPDTEYYFQAYITYKDSSGTIKPIYGQYKQFKTTKSSSPRAPLPTRSPAPAGAGAEAAPGLGPSSSSSSSSSSASSPSPFFASSSAASSSASSSAGASPAPRGPPPPLPINPSVATDDPAKNITINSATIEATITNPNTMAITGRGFDLFTEEPTSSSLNGTDYQNVNITDNIFSITIDSLTPGTKYWVKAYIFYDNNNGSFVANGNVISFTTTGSAPAASARRPPPPPPPAPAADAAAAKAAEDAAAEADPKQWEIQCQNDATGVSKPMFFNKTTSKSQNIKPNCIKLPDIGTLIEPAKNKYGIPDDWEISYNDTDGLYFEDGSNTKYTTCTDTLKAISTAKSVAAAAAAAKAAADAAAKAAASRSPPPPVSAPASPPYMPRTSFTKTESSSKALAGQASDPNDNPFGVYTGLFPKAASPAPAPVALASAAAAAAPEAEAGNLSDINATKSFFYLDTNGNVFNFSQFTDDDIRLEGKFFVHNDKIKQDSTTGVYLNELKLSHKEPDFSLTTANPPRNTRWNILFILNITQLQSLYDAAKSKSEWTLLTSNGSNITLPGKWYLTKEEAQTAQAAQAAQAAAKGAKKLAAAEALATSGAAAATKDKELNWYRNPNYPITSTFEYFAIGKDGKEKYRNNPPQSGGKKQRQPNNKNKNKNKNKKVSIKKNKKRAPTKKTRRNKKNNNKK